MEENVDVTSDIKVVLPCNEETTSVEEIVMGLSAEVVTVCCCNGCPVGFSVSVTFSVWGCCVAAVPVVCAGGTMEI